MDKTDCYISDWQRKVGKETLYCVSFGEESGMIVNENKTIFFCVINSQECDRHCLASGGIRVEWYVSEYLYVC